MRAIENPFDWAKVNTWMWPDDDNKLLQVINQVEDIDLILKFVKKTGVCVQAGGACGVWPYRYSQFFDKVYTFEPLQSNYECLSANLIGIDNITAYNKGLSNKPAKGDMFLDPLEKGNCGAVYFMEGDGDVSVTTIDSLELWRCDLIQLDIEGHELEAIEGGLRTIMLYAPVIVIEEKPLPQISGDYTLARKYLEALGYSEVARVHRDVIFSC